MRDEGASDWKSAVVNPAIIYIAFPSSVVVPRRGESDLCPQRICSLGEMTYYKAMETISVSRDIC